MKVHWTESAIADLSGIESYLTRRSPQFARSVVERIIGKTGSWPAGPDSVRWCRSTTTNYYGSCSSTRTELCIAF
jgi:hypothetical protein